MKADQLPPSENVEDRRDGKPADVRPRLTLMEQEVDPKSKLAKEAGLDDIGGPS